MGQTRVANLRHKWTRAQRGQSRAADRPRPVIYAEAAADTPYSWLTHRNSFSYKQEELAALFMVASTINVFVKIKVAVYCIGVYCYRS